MDIAPYLAQNAQAAQKTHAQKTVRYSHVHLARMSNAVFSATSSRAEYTMKKELTRSKLWTTGKK